MPACPLCKHHFADEVRVCPECGVALTDNPFEEPTQASFALVELGHYPSRGQAQRVVDHLLENGVLATLGPAHETPVRVHVSAEQLTDAGTLAEKLDPGFAGNASKE